MMVVDNIKTLKSEIRKAKALGKSIGFVPTMGYLHEGHISLIKKANEENDFVVVSIFVNPTQFGPDEDFEKYPRDFERDAAMCRVAGTDLVFHPAPSEMYPDSYMTYVEVNTITNKLCGASRPGHFKGVTTIVNKLFNLVEPDKAYFGQKDAQQVAVIQKMVQDLNMNVQIIPCPIIRESDGLAMSSRNTYLSAQERAAALVLSKSLFMARAAIEAGQTDASAVKAMIVDNISKQPLALIDYVEIVDAVTLKDIDSLKGQILIALAVKFGKTRLIDNLRLEV
ncbi:MAG: pantoate--beta-alanine ligase [Bacillota bacterium]